MTLPDEPDAGAAARLGLPERIDFENLVELGRLGEEHIDAVQQPVFDLEALSESNSAAVALMIALFRYSHLLGKPVRFVNIPADLRNIIDVSDLSDVLPFDVRAQPGTEPAAEEKG